MKLITDELVEKVAKALMKGAYPLYPSNALALKWKMDGPEYLPIARAALEAALPDLLQASKSHWEYGELRVAGLKEAMEIMLRCQETPEHSEGVAALIAIRARIAELEA